MNLHIKAIQNCSLDEAKSMAKTVAEKAILNISENFYREFGENIGIVENQFQFFVMLFTSLLLNTGIQFIKEDLNSVASFQAFDELLMEISNHCKQGYSVILENKLKAH